MFCSLAVATVEARDEELALDVDFPESESA
jgi:hypothetical protein